MELMKRFKAQSPSSIWGFMRRLCDEKVIYVQRCNFLQEMNQLSDVYLVATLDEVVVLAVDLPTYTADELIDEEPYGGQEPMWFSHESHRISPLYALRQVMSLITVCSSRRELKNMPVGGVLLSFSNLLNLYDCEDLMKEYGVHIMCNLHADEAPMRLREHALVEHIGRDIFYEMNTLYDCMGLPSLFPADLSSDNDDKTSPASEATRVNAGKRSPVGSSDAGSSTSPEHNPFTDDFNLTCDDVSFDSFEQELTDLFGPLPNHNDDNDDDDDEDDEEENDNTPRTPEQQRLHEFEVHMAKVRHQLDEQYPNSQGQCSIPSRVQVRKPLLRPQDDFDRLVGCGAIRRQIEALTLMSRYTNRLHRLEPAVFTGNPGTGKSTVCKLYGGLLRQSGALKYGHVVVCDRSTFVGNYWGDEEKSVRAVLQMARGGVLMIDEAYQLLGEQQPNDPGRLVLPLMMNFLADPEWSDVAVVLCGYPGLIEDLLAQNPGLSSRFPNRFNFGDFSVEALEQITLNHIADYGYHFTRAAWAKYRWFLREAYDERGNDWSNARFVIHWLERIYVRHGMRCELAGIQTLGKLKTITKSDVCLPTDTY